MKPEVKMKFCCGDICVALESRVLLRSGICVFLVGSLDSKFRIFTGFRSTQFADSTGRSF